MNRRCSPLALLVVLLIAPLARADEDVAAIAARLDAPEDERRVDAARALGALGPRAVPAAPRLVAGLRDGSVEVRLACADALGRAGPVAVPELIALMADPSARAARAAERALLGMAPRFGEADQALLVAAIRAREPSWRAWPLLRVLAAVGPAATSESILALARGVGDDPEYLTGVGARAVPALREALRSGAPDERKVAVRGLAALGAMARDALPDLEAAARGEDEALAEAAAAALIDLGAWSALERLPPLRAVWAAHGADEPGVATLDRLFRRGDAATREAIVAALGGMNVGRGRVPANAAPTLAAALDDPALRPAALGALGNMGYPALDLLVSALDLEHEDPETRLVALAALAQVGLEEATASVPGPTSSTAAERQVRRTRGEAVTRAVRPSLSAGDPRERAAALAVLGAFGDPAALPDVTRAASDPHPSVRAAALRAWAVHVADAPAGAAPDIARALADPELEVTLAAAEALVALGGDARPHVRGAFALEAPATRRAVAHLVEWSFQDEGAPPYGAAALPLLRSPDASVRSAAASHLADLLLDGGPVLEALEAALADPERDVAAYALGGLVRGRCAPLLAALRAETEGGSGEWAGQQLARSVDPAVGQALIALLDTPGGAQALRAQACAALGGRDTAAIPVLRRALAAATTRWDARGPLLALTAFGPASAAALDAVRARLPEKEAIECLAAMGPAAAPAVAELAPLLDGGGDYQVLYACQALVAIGPEAHATLPRLLARAARTGTFRTPPALDAVAAIISAGGGDAAAVADFVRIASRLVDSSEAFDAEQGCEALVAAGPRVRAAGPLLLDLALDPGVSWDDRARIAGALLVVDAAARDALGRGLLRGLDGEAGRVEAAALLATCCPEHHEVAARALGEALRRPRAPRVTGWPSMSERDIAGALAAAGAPGQAALIAGLTESYPIESRVEARRAAAEALGLTAPNTHVVAALADALTDTDREVRWSALSSIGRLATAPGGDAAVAPFAWLLGETLTDPRGPGAFGALAALGPRAAPALSSLLAALELRSRRPAALSVLARLGTAGRPALPRLLELVRAEGAGALPAAEAVLGCAPDVAEAEVARALLRRALLDLEPDDVAAVSAACALGRPGPAWRPSDLVLSVGSLMRGAELGERVCLDGLLDLDQRDRVAALRDAVGLPAGVREAARAALEARR